MDSNIFNQYYQTIETALSEQRLNQALAQEENLLYTNPSWPFLDEVIDIQQAYQGLLGCMEHGFKDDTRKEQFHLLLLRTYKMLHKLNRYYLKEQPNHLYSKSYLSVHKTDYKAYQKLLEQAEQEKKADLQVDELKATLQAHEACLNELFIQIWTTEEFSENEVQELREILQDSAIAKNDKLLCISALTFQQSLCPSAPLLNLLLELSVSQLDIEIRVRSYVGALLLLLKHEKEYLLDPICKKILEEAFAHPEIQQLTCTALNDFYLSLESRNLINKIQNEILPLLNNEKLYSGKAEDMQKLMKSSMKKVEQLMNSGADLQFGSFIQDKNYPFFKKISNWLLPFDSHHSETEFILKEDTPQNASLKVILMNPALCDNDKWSLFYKTRGIQIPLHLDGIKPDEMELIDNTVSAEICCRNYTHDLFRFYNLFPYSTGLDNLLKQDFSPLRHNFLMKLLDKKHLFLLTQILYNNKALEDCLALSKKFIKEKEYTFEAYKLIGDAHRLLQQTAAAITSYENACQIKQEEGLLLQLANCYKQVGRNQDAASIYKELYDQAPENLNFCKQYASCLILCKKTEEAIPLLYKIAYLNEKEKDFVQGSLAWCYLLEDKLEEAWAAWEKIENKTLTDMLNGGHICWAIQDYKNAMDFYKYYLKKSLDRKKAEEKMQEDIKVMKKYQLGKFELRLILEINA